jgi:hypothetical protein
VTVVSYFLTYLFTDTPALYTGTMYGSSTLFRHRAGGVTPKAVKQSAVHYAVSLMASIVREAGLGRRKPTGMTEEGSSTEDQAD